MLHLLSSADVWALTVQDATTLLLAALGLYLPYRAGVLNLGGEGMMLCACFAAVLADDRAQGSAAAGVAAGVAMGVVVSAAFAVMTTSLGAGVLIVGIGLNAVASGGTSAASSALSGGGSISAPTLRPLPSWQLPGVRSIPWVGDVLSGQTPLTYASWAAFAVVVWWLRHTRGGVVLRVTGSRPDVAAALRPVARTQWLALLAGGALVGAAGAQLALAAAPQFSPDMTSGRGFIALALVLIAGSRPLYLLPLAVVFAAFDAAGVNLQTVGLPSELSQVLPYAAVVGLLVIPAARRKLTRRTRRPDHADDAAPDGPTPALLAGER